MAISFIGKSEASGGTTPPFPAGLNDGDYVIGFLYQDNASAAPALPTGWTTPAGQTSAANTQGHRVIGKQVVAGESAPTITGANSILWHAYRGVHKTTPFGGGATTTNIAAVMYPAFTLTSSDGTSWVLGFAGIRTANQPIETPPTGMVNRSDTINGSSGEAAGHDTNGPVTSWTQQAGGGTGFRYRTATIELMADPGGAPTSVTANALKTPAPTIGSPALTQKHGLTATDMVIAPLAIGSPLITQAHSLIAAGLSIAAPALGAPALTQGGALSAVSLTIGAPIIGASALGQIYSLSAANLTLGAISVGAGAFAQSHALAADGISDAPPTIGTPSASAVYALGVSSIVLADPVLGSPSLQQQVGPAALSAQGLDVAAPTLGRPFLTLTAPLVISASRTVKVARQSRSVAVAPIRNLLRVAATHRTLPA